MIKNGISFNTHEHPDSEIRALLSTINALKTNDKWESYFPSAKSVTVNNSANKILTIERKMVGKK